MQLQRVAISNFVPELGFVPHSETTVLGISTPGRTSVLLTLSLAEPKLTCKVKQKAYLAFTALVKTEKRMDMFRLENKCATMLNSLCRQSGRTSAFPLSLLQLFSYTAEPCSVLAISLKPKSVGKEIFLYYVQVSLIFSCQCEFYI